MEYVKSAKVAIVCGTNFLSHNLEVKSIWKFKSNMLTNPFEKFERKRFLYYSKDLNVISMNHALFIKMSKQEFERVKVQMEEDLEQYYSKIKIL